MTQDRECRSFPPSSPLPSSLLGGILTTPPPFRNNQPNPTRQDGISNKPTQAICWGRCEGKTNSPPLRSTARSTSMSTTTVNSTIVNGDLSPV
jgi:hypothetical protein